jgi:SNF2 family DNA or RNA helicase
MPTSPEAIERFLSFSFPEPPPVRGVPKEILLDRIEKACGVPYQPHGFPPYDYQLEALTFALERRRALLLLRVRRGKTKIALDWSSLLLRGGLSKKPGLVVVPNKVVQYVWKIEVEKHSPLRAVAARNAKEFSRAVLAGDFDLLIVTWDSLISLARHWSERKGEVVAIIDKRSLQEISQVFGFGIVDEIHHCKNPKSRRFVIASALFGNFEFRLGLTGTPFGREPFDIWAQAYLIDDGETFGKSYFFFRAAFGKELENRWSPSGVEIVFDERKRELLQKRLQHLSISYGWENLKSAPKILRQTVELWMSDAQEREYKRIIGELIHSQRGGDRKAIQVSFAQLREVSSGFLKFKSEDDEDQFAVNLEPAPKLDWFEELFEELDEESSVAIFHEFVRTGELLAERACKLGIPYGELNGRTKDPEKVLKQFEARKIRILIANWRSAGTGVDLSVADYHIFAESPVSPIDRTQAEARAFANRGDRPLYLIDIVSSPIERKILEYLQEGKDLLQAIVFSREDLSGILSPPRRSGKR